MGSHQVLLLVGHSHTQASQATGQMDRLAIVLALVACSSPVEPSQPPPTEYREWYAEVEACSGLRGDFDRIHWTTQPDVIVDGHSYYGYWYTDNTIVIRSDLVDYKHLVQHEEMHSLLRSGQHPSEYFNQKCGDLINL